MQPPNDRPIVVGIDEGADSGQAVEWAARYAELTGRPLLLTYAEFDPYSVVAADAAVPASLDLGMAPTDAKRVLDDAVELVRQSRPLVRVRTYSEPAYAANLLLEQGKSAAMIVLGNDGSGVFSELLLGSVCGRLIAKATCPVVAVRARRAEPEPGAEVIVGVDGSPVCERAVEFAFDYAAAEGRPLRLVHVLHGGRPQYGADEGACLRHTERLRDRLAGQYPWVRADIELAEGDPVDALSAAGATARLLVVGARGRGVAAGLLTGSVSHAVLRDATFPVAVVRKGCASIACE